MYRFIQIVFEAIKSARWLTRARLISWGGGFAVLSLLLLAHDVIRFPTGVAEGGDFTIFWSGAVLAAAGRPEAAYAVGPDHTFDQALPYPPIMILLCRPLAIFSQTEALILWLVLGTGLYACSLSRFVGWRIAVLATFGTPAALCNIICGQNGYFTAVLLGWGLAFVDRRPVSAGLLLGLLCSKPQLGILLPVALVAGGQWRALAAAAAWAIFLVAASTILLGPGAWLGFFEQMVVERRLLQFGSSTWAGMPTVFVLTRMAGADLTAAYLMQGVSAVSAAAAVALLWYRQSPFGVKSAGLAVGTFLVTPHAYYYDMIVLIFAAAWFANEAIKTGFLPWEKIAIFSLLTLPALSLLPALVGFQIGPILLWLTMAVILRRGLAYPSPGIRRAASRATRDDSRLPV
jgi:hypothetical protein